MALLLRDREAANGAATPPPNGGASASVPDFACESCGAGMQRGQDWCLECGTAARGRLGAKPGWRAAFVVVALTLLLVAGAGIAGYAALTSDSERTAAAPSAGNGNPIVAPGPAAPDTGIPGPTATTITPGATGPGTTPPAVTGAPPAATGVTPGVQTPPPAAGSKLPVIPAPTPVKPSTNTPVVPQAGTPTPTPSTGTGTTPSTATTTPPPAAVVKPQIIKLTKDAATTYDPTKRPGAEVGPAANAIDGKPNTVWDVTVPADGNPIGVGVMVDLGAPYALQSLRLAIPAGADGYKVELYGAVDDKEIPADLIDKRWQHLTDVKSVVDGAPIPLKGKGDAPKYKRFLIFVTTPGQSTDPRAAIGEITLRGTL